jgi:hypothetical protein
MRILCLILASDTAPEYLKFQKLWRRMMKVNPQVDCYFYKGHPDLTVPVFLEDDTLWIRVHENLESVYEKTLRAFEYFVPRLHEYDFVYRSNLSTFVSFAHMLQFCRTLPRTMGCGAVIGGIPPEDEVRNSLEAGFSFPGGNGFILTPDIVKRLVEEKIPLVDQDDITIGVALRKWGIRIQEFTRPDYRDQGSWYMNNPRFLKDNEWNLDPKTIMFTYRLKSFDRMRDVDMMDFLIKKIYSV